MGTVERAYELARSGECASLEDLRRKLRREGHEAVLAHIQGSLARELGRLIAESQDARAAQRS